MIEPDALVRKPHITSIQASEDVRPYCLEPVHRDATLQSLHILEEVLLADGFVLPTYK